MSSDPQQSSATIEELEALTFGFEHWPLDHFRGMSAEQIEAHEGIGPKFRKRIEALLSELDELRRAAGVAVPAAATPAPATEPDEYLEPAAPGRGGPLVFVMVVLLVAIIMAVVMFAGGKSGVREVRHKLHQAEAQIQTTRQALGGIADQLVSDAIQQSERVAQKARDRHFGAALEHLDSLEKSLRTMHGAEQAAPPAKDRSAVRAEALEALEVVRGALLLTEPHSQQQVEEACQKLRTTVQALQGEVKE